MPQKTIDELVDRSKALAIIKEQPKQTKVIFLSVLSSIGNNNNAYTNSIWKTYTDLCKSFSLKILTKRRFGGILSELKKFGFVSTEVISKGRYGRMRDIKLSLSKEVCNEIENYLKGDMGKDN